MKSVESTPQLTNRTWLMTVLVGVYASNFVDRMILNVLQQPIKAELQLQDWQLGMLSGTTFAFFYAFLGLYVARVAEHGDRTKVAAACILLWSTMTALCGLATQFVHLLLLRIGVAVGEAGATPTGQSLISDYYEPERRAGALAIFQSGNTIGHVLGAVLGGVVGQAWGWRWAFILAGAPGLILAALMLFTVREPRRHAATRDPVPDLGVVARELFGKPTFRWMTLGTAATLFASYAISSFISPHLMRSYQLGLQSAGLLGGVGGGLMLGAGTLIGGFSAQALARTNRAWLLRVPGLALLAAAPLCIVAFSGSGLPVTIGAFLMMNLCVGTFQGPVFATNHSLVTSRMRATASAILLLLITLGGLGLGPLLVGLASDRLAATAFAGGNFAADCGAGTVALAACAHASAEGLRWALLACFAVFALAGLCFLRSARTIAGDVLD